MPSPVTRRDVIARGLGAALAFSIGANTDASGESAEAGDDGRGGADGDTAARSRQPAAQDDRILREIPGRNEHVPAVGLGTWQTFDVGAAETERAVLRDVLRSFVPLGGSVIDSSPMYGRSEDVVGDLQHELGLRADLFVATKVWTRGREEGIRQMRESMRKLRVDRVDLMQVHNLLDVDTHLATLNQWKQEGLVRHVGVTHYQAGAFDDLERTITRHDVDFVQFNYSLHESDAERRMLPFARDRGVAVLINRPFAQGNMFSRVRGKPLPPFTADLGITSWAQYFLKWVISHPAVTCAIPATADPVHLADNMGALHGPLPDDAQRREMQRWFASL
jgi:diketogulonate reductase-like aldo/keto reductase